MSRLIDADYVLQKLENFRKKREDEAKYTGDREAKVGWNDTIFAIKMAPTVQPEIIRCRDCKHLMKLLDEKSAEKFGQEYACECGRLNKPEPDDFCSRAKRRTDETD